MTPKCFYCDTPLDPTHEDEDTCPSCAWNLKEGRCYVGSWDEDGELVAVWEDC